MMLPTVHLNGTSLEDLLSQASAGQRAMRAAMEAVSCARPHDRDYYPAGAEAGPRARAEHEKRMEALRAVEKDFGELVRHLTRVRRDRDALRAGRSSAVVGPGDSREGEGVAF
jgi:hypothetical protein